MPYVQAMQDVAEVIETEDAEEARRLTTNGWMLLTLAASNQTKDIRSSLGRIEPNRLSRLHKQCVRDWTR